MNFRIKVSVIMYVKNGMPYFMEAIDSIIKQTLESIEIIVVDGGSTDETIKIAQNVSKHDKRIRIFHSERGSVGAQLNLALSEARGEYIGIVESDDRILPDMYEKEYAFAEKMGFPDVVRADNYIFWGHGNSETALRTSLCHDSSNYGVILSAEQFPKKVLIGGSFWTGIYKRRFLLEKNIFANESKGAAYQDFSFLFQASVLADSICFMKDAFYYYRKDNPQSSCNSPIGINLIDGEYLFLREIMEKRKLWDKYRTYYYIWKVRNYLWFYKNISSDMREKVLRLMYESIYEDAHDEAFPLGDLNNNEKSIIEMCMLSFGAFSSYLKGKDEEWFLTCDKLKKLNSSDIICLFGAGNIADIMIKYLEYRNIVPKCVFDNNRDIWGDKKQGINIVSPENLKKMVIDNQNPKVIICSEYYANEIKDQVLQIGVDKKRIMVCDNMDACVRVMVEDNSKHKS